MEYEIRPANRYRFGFSEIWEYRELFFFFTWRDIKVRYRQTALGAVWAILQPLLLTAVFTLFFANALGIKTGSLPYPLFAFCGMMVWSFFSTGLTTSSNSLVSASAIIRKIYFPRLILPASAVLASLLDFLITLLLLAGLTCYYGLADRLPLLLITFPVSLLISTMTLAGAGCFFSALNVKYRDFRYVIPFALQVFFFLTPVIYPSSLLPSGFVRDLFEMNPISVAIEMTRSALGGPEVPLQLVLKSTSIACLILIGGVVYFRRTEYYFADLA